MRLGEPDTVENKVFCPNVGQVLAVAVEGAPSAKSW
jgi:hypothetical protein